MEKRLLLAVALSITVLLTFQLMLSPQRAPSKEVAAIPTKEQPKKIEEVTVKRSLPESAVTRSVSNEKYNLDLTDMGGGIQRIVVKNQQGRDFYLVDNAIFNAGILSMEGSGGFSGLSSEKFAIRGNSAYLEYNGLRIEKAVVLSKDRYGIGASVNITNTSGINQALSYDLTAASNISRQEKDEPRYIEADICYKDGKIQKINGAKLLAYNRLYKDNIEWITLKNKYYAIIAKPLFNVKGVFTNSVAGEPIIGFIVDDGVIAPGEIKSYNLNFYIGPVDIKELEKVDQGFTKALNFGFLTSISLILLSILQFFYSIVHNYGIAILLLTIFTSLFLYPLTFKSLKSMQKLQELQPHIEKIKSEHKDNPTKLNKEIMELYRRYNVNPMGGCLPMLLQMPVFIALYNTLSRSIELKGAGFLWIKDLSGPDAFFTLGSSLPFLGNTINLLPILMIGAMIIQQKLSQVSVSQSTEQQKMMAFLMPIMFGFIFYSLPSGLVLYWLTNTVVTSALQFALFKKQSHEKHDK